MTDPIARAWTDGLGEQEAKVVEVLVVELVLEVDEVSVNWTLGSTTARPREQLEVKMAHKAPIKK